MDSSDAFEVELNELLGPLKQAAIDAYMCSECMCFIEGDSYCFAQDPYQMVTRPDGQGNGGGEYSGGSAWRDFAEEVFDGNRATKGYKDSFKNIRTMIDNLFDSWKTLPNPEAIGAYVDYYRVKVIASLAQSTGEITVPSALDSSPTLTLPSIGGGGSMGVQVGNLEMHMPNLRGTAMSTFKETYYSNLKNVISNLCVVTNVHCSSFLAEMKYFSDLRPKVIEIVKNATNSFASLRVGSGKYATGLFQITFDFLDKGLSALALPGYSAAEGTIKAGSLVLQVKNKVKEMKGRSTTPTSYSQMRDELKATVDDLNTGLRNGEQLIWDNSTANMTEMAKDKGMSGASASLHLEPAAITSSPSEMEMDESTVNEVSKALLAIRDLVNLAASGIPSCTMQTIVMRDGSIGKGANGPGVAFDQMGQIIYELLLDLGWKIEEGVVGLKLALNDVQAQDETSRKALELHQSELSAGSGVDPWDKKNQTSKDVESHRNKYFTSHDDHDDKTPTQNPTYQELAELMRQSQEEQG